MKLNVQFLEINPRFFVTFDENLRDFGTIFEEVQTVTQYVGGEVYTGEYEITPKVSEQKMPTAGKVMTDDVTVCSIPYFDVGNIYGGSTVYIASEV